ncbi:MAG: phage minor head protein [Pseudotabrizicola sp.]|uniref:phage head morphogenesis protein n=1 Tax=Pseudotabrizicola sp. TaxID=2939647 RepID=UPI00271861E6|nr:phage minor head protein [Pseudotabrizicola sp.]MDO9639681.1 phage minor head protein [Pseudotabrizicola sp.]
MAELAGIFRRPFTEQVAAFRLRLTDLRPTAAWTDLWQAEHDRAFMVAGALKADLLTDLAGAVQKAIEDGTSLEQFRADFREIVTRRGWHGWTGEGTKPGEAWRTRVIYKTNMSTSYAAGRWAQLKAAGYPLLIYRHGGSLDPRPEHLSWDGLILPVDHPFWVTHAPPNGWGCSCYVTGARSERDAVRKGGKPGKVLPDGWTVLSPRTGAPVGIDKGWAYAPGASVPDTIARVAGKLPDLPVRVAESLRAVLPDPARTDVLERVAEMIGATGPDAGALAVFDALAARAHPEDQALLARLRDELARRIGGGA